MTRRRDIRSARKMASALDWHELEGEPEPENTDELPDEEHDGWQPIRARETPAEHEQEVQ